MLLTVLGELVLPTGEPVWTASLLHVLTGMGFAEQAARQAISRAANGGWIESQKVGRKVRWSVTGEGTRIIEEITQRVLSLQNVPERWDGDCVILVISIPHAKESVRKRLYAALGWSGFGCPSPGLWASPHVGRLSEADAVIRELGLEDSTISFIGQTAKVGLTDHQIVERAWDLEHVAARYQELIAKYEILDPLAGDELLFTYLALVHEWRQFPYMDPQLPRDLLPEWVGHRAVDTFTSLRRRWTSAAHDRWREIGAPVVSGCS
jgi:phenylacetic acid degradation operon negative regulatory protein